MGKTRRSVARYAATTAVLALLCAAWVYPFLWMVSASLKSSMEVISSGLNLVPAKLLFENYLRAWQAAHFNVYFFNTVVITGATVILVVFRCSLAGYVFGRYKFPGAGFIMALLVLTLFIPTGSTVIPVVELSMRLGLLNSRAGIILAFVGGGHVASILMYSSFFRQIPDSLEEAAYLDGAGFFRIFKDVMLPLSGPVTATVGVLTFMFAWNSFLLPLVFTFSRPELRTLPVGMMAFSGMHETDWSGMAAGATISLLPIVVVFLFVQRFFVEGIAGAVKS